MLNRKKCSNEDAGLVNNIIYDSYKMIHKNHTRLLAY